MLCYFKTCYYDGFKIKTLSKFKVNVKIVIKTLTFVELTHNETKAVYKAA